MPLAFPWSTANHWHRRSRTGRQTGKTSGSLTPLCGVRRQGIPRRVLECGHAAPPRPSKRRNCSEMRSSPLFLGIFALALLLPLLLACAGPDQPTAVPSSERATAEPTDLPDSERPTGESETQASPAQTRSTRGSGPRPLPPVHRLRHRLRLPAPPKQTGQP